jgi:hypothetical protein
MVETTVDSEEEIERAVMRRIQTLQEFAGPNEDTM